MFSLLSKFSLLLLLKYFTLSILNVFGRLFFYFFFWLIALLELSCFPSIRDSNTSTGGASSNPSNGNSLWYTSESAAPGPFFPSSSTPTITSVGPVFELRQEVCCSEPLHCLFSWDQSLSKVSILLCYPCSLHLRDLFGLRWREKSASVSADRPAVSSPRVCLCPWAASRAAIQERAVTATLLVCLLRGIGAERLVARTFTSIVHVRACTACRNHKRGWRRPATTSCQGPRHLDGGPEPRPRPQCRSRWGRLLQHYCLFWQSRPRAECSHDA